MITLVIADDQALVRAGFRKLVEHEPDMEVVAEAQDGVRAVEAARALRPDVVLMDIRMPNMDGLEATRRIMLNSPAARVLVLTTFDLDEYVFDALRAGASGFVLKDCPPDALTAAIRHVVAGDTLLAPSITRRLVEQFVRRPRPGARLPDELAELTQRELQVLRLIARGLSNAEIARSLYVSDTTVKSHVTRLLAKLGVRDRVQAVVMAYESGLVHAGEETPNEHLGGVAARTPDG